MVDGWGGRQCRDAIRARRRCECISLPLSGLGSLHFLHRASAQQKRRLSVLGIDQHNDLGDADVQTPSASKNPDYSQSTRSALRYSTGRMTIYIIPQNESIPLRERAELPLSGRLLRFQTHRLADLPHGPPTQACAPINDDPWSTTSLHLCLQSYVFILRSLCRFPKGSFRSHIHLYRSRVSHSPPSWRLPDYYTAVGVQPH